jgi:hypothetical protein
MIAFGRLGNYGRLGNQMFQVAATLGIAKRVNTIAAFESAKIRDVFTLEDCYFPESVDSIFSYQEKSFDFDKNILSIPDKTIIFGYFQSEKYFDHCYDLITRNFSFKKDILAKAQNEMKKYGNNICSIHVRRGDYLNLSDTHPYVGDDYYKNAMEKIGSDSKFLVFSDDIEWCKKSDIFKNCDFVEVNDEAIELCMMTLCNYHIIANSSFSWWGAKLSNSKMTIAPKTWFGPKGPPTWNDIYCCGWKVL